jgi:hypothetical protein
MQTQIYAQRSTAATPAPTLYTPPDSLPSQSSAATVTVIFEGRDPEALARLHAAVGTKHVDDKDGRGGMPPTKPQEPNTSLGGRTTPLAPAPSTPSFKGKKNTSVLNRKIAIKHTSIKSKKCVDLRMG